MNLKHIQHPFTPFTKKIQLLSYLLTKQLRKLHLNIFCNVRNIIELRKRLEEANHDFFVGVTPKLRVANLLKSYSMEELFLHQRTDLQEEEKSKNAKFSTLSNPLVEVNDS